uniref:Histone H2A C-terminal domain-containing protein n=1 Tax=Solanum lycopersicum TaxID=4081 RepID=A0A3Q7GJH8_SOLLC
MKINKNPIGVLVSRDLKTPVAMIGKGRSVGDKKTRIILSLRHLTIPNGGVIPNIHNIFLEMFPKSLKMVR